MDLVTLHAAVVSAWADRQGTQPAHAAGAMANMIPVLMASPELLADERGRKLLDELMLSMERLAEHCAFALGATEAPADA